MRFFSKFRKKVLLRQDAQKYLLYAAGEILLIMVGILLAVQINLWNEGRKQRRLELETLAVLRSEMLSDQKDLEANQKIYESAQKSCQIIARHLHEAIPYDDSLAFHFLNFANYSTFNNRSGGYETLKSKGVELISNKDLRLQIIELYEFNFPMVKKMEANDLADVEESKRFLFQHFISLGYQGKTGIVPIDYPALINDLYFKNRLDYLESLRGRSDFEFGRLARQVDLLMDRITEEMYQLTGKDYRKQAVTFRLNGYDTAGRVVLTGNFAGWDTEKIMMEYQAEEKAWVKTLELFPGEKYLYKFLVDGRWMDDPDNPEKEKSTYYNSYNSVLRVKPK